MYKKTLIQEYKSAHWNFSWEDFMTFVFSCQLNAVLFWKKYDSFPSYVSRDYVE